jgi:hypothetical protein
MPTTPFHPVTAAASRKPARLNELSPPADTIRFLREKVRLTQKEIGRMLASDERTVRRWTADPDGAAPQARFAQRIDDLRDLVELLYDTLPGEQTGRWLRARNRLLHGARPIDLLAEGNYLPVREAARAYVDGDPL